jgi:hypothetical protein
MYGAMPLMYGATQMRKKKSLHFAPKFLGINTGIHFDIPKWG